MSTLIINEGVSPQTGIETRTHFADGEIVIQKTVDMEPYLEAAKAAREANEGKRWGDGRKVGTLPPHIYGQALQIRDDNERRKFILRYFQENPALVHYEPYLKG